jgi:hypothetical protein
MQQCCALHSERRLKIVDDTALTPKMPGNQRQFQRDPMRVHADYRPYSVRYYRASHPMTYPTTCICKRYRSTEWPNSAGLKSPMTECLKCSVIQEFITSAFFHLRRFNPTRFFVYFHYKDAAAFCVAT